MLVSFVYDGVPKVTLVVSIPKARKVEIPAKDLYKIRLDLQRCAKTVSAESQSRPDTFAHELFKTVKANFDNIVLNEVAFTLVHEDGESTMVYTLQDVKL